MESIQQNSDKIIGIIDSIASKKNILTLNTAVKAAPAGEQGCEFAVTGVRILAQRSTAPGKR